MAAPITALVSWIAVAAHKPNSDWERLICSAIRGKNNMPIAFNKKIMAMAIDNSWGFDLITGATAAIAVPPQIDEPDAIKYMYDCFKFSSFPKIKVNKKTKTTNKDIGNK